MTTNIHESILKKSLNCNTEIIVQLLTIENVLRAHKTVMISEMNLQQKLMERLWTISKRYTLLESTGSSSPYMEKYSLSVDSILQEFTCKFQQIKNSNCRINFSLVGLRKSWQVFCTLCAQLDINIESPLVIGNVFHKPMSYFLELISDIVKYFHAWLLKLKFLSNLIDPHKIHSIEKYRKQIEISEDFDEYITMGLTYCKNLCPKKF